jgi:hypothetical protein
MLRRAIQVSVDTRRLRSRSLFFGVGTMRPEPRGSMPCLAAKQIQSNKYLIHGSQRLA